MAFIPIDAKADVQGSKKGKMTPAQHAQINAWCLSSKTGILDCLGKCLYDETKTSFVPSSDREVVVVFHSGYIAICGRIVECEEGTRVSVTVPVTGEINGKIILRYNLSASGEEEFVVTTTTESLVQEDLNNNPLTGRYELELYSYTASSSALKLHERTQPYVPDIGGKLEQFITVLTGTGIEGEGDAPLQGYKKSEGTIEKRLENLNERLTSLGFSRGVFGSFPDANMSGFLYKSGVCVTGFLWRTQTQNEMSLDVGKVIATIPEEFRPYTTYTEGIGMNVATNNITNSYSATIDVTQNGEVKIASFGANANTSGKHKIVTNFTIMLGWLTKDPNTL